MANKYHVLSTEKVASGSWFPSFRGYSILLACLSFIDTLSLWSAICPSHLTLSSSTLGVVPNRGSSVWGQ